MNNLFFQVMEKHLDEVFESYVERMVRAKTHQERESILNEFVSDYGPEKLGEGRNGS